MDRDELLRVLRAFEEERLEYVLIGAAAMGFHGLVRATEDLDVLVRRARESGTAQEGVVEVQVAAGGVVAHGRVVAEEVRGADLVDVRIAVIGSP